MKKKECKNCHKVKTIKNSHFQLCNYCNIERLKALKKSSDTNIPKNKESSLKRTQKSLGGVFDNNYFVKKTKNIKKASEKIKEDEIFYEKCFNLSDHKCEECGIDLPSVFRDSDGKVVARWRYSHIVPKSIAPNLRHDTENINHLCIKHHTQWDFENKTSMKIYAKNKVKFPNYFT